MHFHFCPDELKAIALGIQFLGDIIFAVRMFLMKVLS